MDTQAWICEWVDRHVEEFSDLSQEIWSCAELSGQEYKSSSSTV